MTLPLQVPIVFGHWLIEGNKLLCRLPRKTVTVQAPKKLLLALMHACDGSRAWGNVVDMLQRHWDAETLVPFMQALVRDGVLVDASLLWAHWADVAQLPVTTVISTSNKDISALHRVAESRLLPGHGIHVKGITSGRNPLAKIFSKRESTRTFDDKPISVECLCTVLWAAHGVTRADENSTVHWHRTIASGGNMHSARWFVAVLRELVSEQAKGDLVTPGIYEARFHTLGGVSLQKMSGNVLDAWRCLRDPRVLRFASALVMPVYDVSVPAKKYGNRATLYAVMEAGQALQNAQLMAFELGASGMLRGDTIAHESLRMLGLKNGSSHWLSVPAMVVGAQATHKQLMQQQHENALKIIPNLRWTDNSFAFASSLAAADNPLFVASGRSRDPKIALTKAEAEGWERLAWTSPVGNTKLAKLQMGRFAEVEEAIDPNTIVAYSKRQYQRKDFPLQPFSLRKPYLWVNAKDVKSGKSCQVLADCVYASSALPSRFQKSLFTNTSTSGMAAGVSVEDALCRATLELIERDAFVRAWVSRKAPPIIKNTSLPRSEAARIKALTQAGFRLVVSDLSTAWAPVVSVFAQSDQLPFTAITAAADFSSEQALSKALDEMEGRIAHVQNFAPPMANDEDPMRQIESQYRNRLSYKNADFYVCRNAAVVFNAVGAEACQNWRLLRSRISNAESGLLIIDMTPENSAIEQGRIPLHVVRAIVPGFIPIWFQDGLQPEGMLGLASAGLTGDRQFSNKFSIHPFS